MKYVVICTPYKVRSSNSWTKIKGLSRAVETVVKEDNAVLIPQLMYFGFERYGDEFARKCRRAMVKISDKVKVYTKRRNKEMMEIIEAANELGKPIIYYPDFK